MTLRDMLNKLHCRVTTSNKKAWIKWSSQVRSYVAFNDLPPISSNDFKLQPQDKSFDITNYYNPYMLDIITEGELLKASKDNVEADHQREEAFCYGR